MKYLLIVLLIAINCTSDRKHKHILTLKDFSKVEGLLTSGKSVYNLGENPKIKSIITNSGKEEITLIHALDGSNDSIRFPILKFDIYRNDTLLKNTGFRCGNLDGLSFKSFVKLNPGESFDPNLSAPSVYQEHLLDSISFQKTGKYKINFYYSTVEDTLENWIGWDSALRLHELDLKAYKTMINTYKEAFREVPKVSITSNILEFEIK